MFFRLVTRQDNTGPLFSKFILVRFWIIEILTSNQTLAVANHPNLASHPAENDGTGRDSFLRMVSQIWDFRLLILLADLFSDTQTEIVTRYAFWGFANILPNEFHGIAPITIKETVTTIGLRGRAVNDCNEIVSDDDAVLAFLLGIFRYDDLFYYLHMNDLT